MPRRRSDRPSPMYQPQVPGMLLDVAPVIGEARGLLEAKEAAELGNYGQAGMAAVGAVPLIGDGWKFFKRIKEATEEAEKFKAKEIVVEMSPDEFLRMADKAGVPNYNKLDRLKDVEQFDDVPFLNFELDGDLANVVGHEGRHRALKLREKGVQTMPVRLRGEIRWDQQMDPDLFDHRKAWPKKLVAENGDAIIDFPVKRGQVGTVPRKPGVIEPYRSKELLERDKAIEELLEKYK